MSENTLRRSGRCDLLGLLALPCSFLEGLLTGLIAPLAAIAAMVVSIRLITGKFPFLGQVVTDEAGERRLSLQLVAPERVAPLWEEHKRTFGDELNRLRLEIQSIAEEPEAQD